MLAWAERTDSGDSLLAAATDHHFERFEFSPGYSLHDTGGFLERARTADEMMEEGFFG